MYRLNPLMRNVLITVDEVIFHAPTKHTLDPRTIESSIIVAEERFIRPALGDLLYNSICTEKNTLVTSLNQVALQTAYGNAKTLEVGDIVNALEFLSSTNLKLWKEQLWKLCAEAVMLLALPEGFVQFGSQGVIHNAPVAGPMGAEGVSTPELKSVRWAMDKKLQDRIDPLVNSLKNWICNENKTIVPKPYLLYTFDCPCEPGSEVKRKSGLVFIYDEPENKCGCDGW